MTKKKHPHSRAERLARKRQEFNETPKKEGAKVRRKVIESLREEETRDELKQEGLARKD